MGFGQSCMPIKKPCDVGLVCDHLRKCKRPSKAACKHADECSSQRCVNGKCGIAETGEKCSRRADCGEGSYCSNKDRVCRLTTFRGAACEQDDMCVTSRCLNGRCEAPALGRPCTGEGTECEGFLICKSGTCAYRLQEGDACQATVECEYGRCYEGTCRVRLTSGSGTCKNDADCSGSKVCSRFGNCCARNDGDCSEARG